ncbi:MAG: hypothetical protein HYY52_08830 [Candidatus Melainabacteria bacterium]|nr:hypothetical protein [Candidatus Melainabacteria bacterium]
MKKIAITVFMLFCLVTSSITAATDADADDDATNAAATDDDDDATDDDDDCSLSARVVNNRNDTSEGKEISLHPGTLEQIKKDIRLINSVKKDKKKKKGKLVQELKEDNVGNFYVKINQAKRILKDPSLKKVTWIKLRPICLTPPPPPCTESFISPCESCQLCVPFLRYGNQCRDSVIQDYSVSPSQSCTCTKEGDMCNQGSGQGGGICTKINLTSSPSCACRCGNDEDCKDGYFCDPGTELCKKRPQNTPMPEVDD